RADRVEPVRAGVRVRWLEPGERIRPDADDLRVLGQGGGVDAVDGGVVAVGEVVRAARYRSDVEREIGARADAGDRDLTQEVRTVRRVVAAPTGRQRQDAECRHDQGFLQDSSPVWMG